FHVTGVQTCALPISSRRSRAGPDRSSSTTSPTTAAASSGLGMWSSSWRMRCSTRAPRPTRATVTASISGLTAMIAGRGSGTTRREGRPTRLVAPGSASCTRPSSTSSATSAPMVDRLRPVSAVRSAREGVPPRCTSSSTVERFRRRTESTVSPRAATSHTIAAAESSPCPTPRGLWPLDGGATVILLLLTPIAASAYDRGIPTTFDVVVETFERCSKMNRARIIRVGAIAAASALTIGGLTACSAGGGGNEDGDVTITWWHNATSDPQKGMWEDVAAEFEKANPGVKVEVTGYQNEDLQRTLIPNALQSGDAPDIFMVWPGGEVRSQADAGYLMDLTDVMSDTISEYGGTVKPWQVDGKQYAIPYTFGIEGFWYNKDLFKAAGIDELPETLPELEDANKKLRAAGTTPIAVGAGDLWPAGHWWYQFALAACSTDTLQKAIPALDFSDPCWVEAGELLQDFVATNPFQDG